MPEKYTLRSAEVNLESGVKVTADVGSIEALTQLVADLKAAGLGEIVDGSAFADERSPRTPEKKDDINLDDPTARIETEIGVDSGRLLKAKILAIKDGVPQVLRTSAFGNVTEAILALMFALEHGLRQKPVNYDDFANLFEAQNLKSGSPLAMIVNNARNSGYFDSRAYLDGRRLILTPKGHQKAIEVLKRVAASS